METSTKPANVAYIGTRFIGIEVDDDLGAQERARAATELAEATARAAARTIADLASKATEVARRNQIAEAELTAAATELETARVKAAARALATSEKAQRAAAVRARRLAVAAGNDAIRALNQGGSVMGYPSAPPVAELMELVRAAGFAIYQGDLRFLEGIVADLPRETSRMLCVSLHHGVEEYGLTMGEEDRGLSNCLHITVYQLRSGNWETLAYLS